MERVVLCDFYFCCAFIFGQPMKKFEFLARPEPLVNDILSLTTSGSRDENALVLKMCACADEIPWTQETRKKKTGTSK